MDTESFDLRLARRILASVSVGYFLLPFMLAGVSAILPAMGADLHASAQDLGMITATYTLGMAVTQLAAGRMGDIWGRKRMFLCGMGLFIATGFILCTVTSLPLFILLRFVQGCGAALFNASGLALLAGVVPARLRGRYLGINAAAVYAGIACGPPISGCITGLLGWRWVFLLCALTAALDWLLMRCAVRQEWRVSRGEPFDWAGCAVYVAGMAALTCGADRISAAPLSGWGLLALSVLLLGLFWRHEKHAAYPLLHVRLFYEHRAFTLSSLASFINYSAIFGAMFFFSLYLQITRGFSVQEAGLLLTVQALVQVLTSVWAGGLADRRGPGVISACGIALCGTGILCAALLDMRSPIWSIVIIQAVMGLGVSLFAVPNTSIILSSVDKRYLGQASSVNGAVRTTGMLANMIIVTITLGVFLGNAPAGPSNTREFLAAMRTDFIIFGLLNLLAVGCALARERRHGAP